MTSQGAMSFFVVFWSKFAEWGEGEGGIIDLKNKKLMCERRFL